MCCVCNKYIAILFFVRGLVSMCFGLYVLLNYTCPPPFPPSPLIIKSTLTVAVLLSTYVLILFPYVSYVGLSMFCKRVKVKVKQSRNRPGVSQRVLGGLGSQVSWHSAREGDEVVSLTHRPPLSPGMFLVLIFTRGWVDPRAMVRSEGNMLLKNPVTLPGIDPGIVKLVTQRLNNYTTPGPVAHSVPGS